MSNNLKNCINYDFNQKVKWNFYINLRDVTDLKELDELLSEEDNCYTKMNNENKIKNINNICEKNLLGEIIKAYIFCKSVKIKETCNLCLMSWISTRQCWFDCDELLLNKYFEGLLEPLIFICKVLKEKVIYHFYQIPKELYIVFINKFKKYLRIYKDKEIILSIISSAWDIFYSKIYSQN
ncbi:conserved Plasmodium protein, unknown function [Plasmodium gallinaceum]|uniref:Uncharacterized protein n=1 Tax=Plasmodium gallinaceum TaxID=5849 RepID=A0A1J1GZA4_PLAGA|nr:conserved Plasmodium protein, unknown function [Plasmodium gallinaceum]CRG96347.1 conserved Plasmodium protein, unknown function [Plasmodium gallinaceum]